MFSVILLCFYMIITSPRLCFALYIYFLKIKLVKNWCEQEKETKLNI